MCVWRHGKMPGQVSSGLQLPRVLFGDNSLFILSPPNTGPTSSPSVPLSFRSAAGLHSYHHFGVTELTGTPRARPGLTHLVLPAARDPAETATPTVPRPRPRRARKLGARRRLRCSARPSRPPTNQGRELSPEPPQGWDFGTGLSGRLWSLGLGVRPRAQL